MRVTVSSSIIALQLLCVVQPAFAATVWGEDLGTYDAAMNYAKSENSLAPLADGLWHPELPLTRMDLVTSVVRSVYKEDINNGCFDNISPVVPARFTHLFRDITRTDAHAKEVCVAMFVGILQGKPDGSLMPEQSANLVEVAKMVTKAYGIAPFPGLRQEPGVPWHEPFWYALAKRNAIPATVKSRSATISRGEFAEILFALRNDKPVVGFRETPTKVSASVQESASASVMKSTAATDAASLTHAPALSQEAANILARRDARHAARAAYWAKATVSALSAVKATAGPALY